MFAIYVHSLGKYMCKDHTKVIVFDNFNKADAFVQAFYGFAMSQGLGAALTGDPSLMMDIQTAMNSTEIKEFTEAGKETINFDDLKR